ncbi:hypothetical protein FE391_36160 [Nonomuraea sp. KC401]|uniref:hypothetical protein n=1 Tax=unclassified Nonomuraea TaxID=2593643 RepID=UPI0010FDB760|nr:MULTISPECIES: hypothetical protein [unclassified Nonomuraea]NBE97805.1 hypothetical protein [Nonomuraea sp. K271]TLF58630.1 hypothetical protein FE391_36160 [Nonomuraea sp. KC401]
MSEKPEDKPDAVGRVEGESDVVAERSGADTPTSRRPVSADLPVDDPQEGPQEDSGEEEENGNEVVRPDAGPTG